MGNQTSRLPSSPYANVAPYFPSNETEMFRTNAEELAFALKFVPEDLRPESCPFKLTDVMIINMCMNVALFTNEGSEYNLLKNVLIPALSNSHLASQKDVVLVNAMFNFVRERGEFYRSHHDKIGKLELVPQDGSDDVQVTEKPIPFVPGNLKINSKVVPQITSSAQFIAFVRGTVPTPVRFFKKNMECFRAINSDIDVLFNKEKANFEFLYHCFIWAVATGNSSLLVRTGEASFLLAMDAHKRDLKVEAFRLDEAFLSSVRSDCMFGFAMEKQTISHIEYSEFKIGTSQQRSVLAAGLDSVFLLESGLILTKISLSKQITERRKRFRYCRMGPVTSEVQRCIAVSNDFL